MNQTQTTIISVNGPQTTTTGKQFWVVVDASGVEYRVWEAVQAQKAMSLVNQFVTLTYVEKANGSYVNRSFKDAQPAQGNTFGSTGVPAQGVPAAVPQSAPVAAAAAPAPQVTEAVPSLRDAQIVRQSAYKAAAEFLTLHHELFAAPEGFEQSLSALRRVTDELTAYGLTGNWGGGNTEPAAAEPVSADAAPWD